jgi:predicted PurR-regulated permease PerM
MDADSVAGDSPDPGRRVTLRLEFPARTIFRILLVLAALWLLAQVWIALFEVFLGLLIALALIPVVGRLERRGLTRNASVAIVVGGSVLALALIVSVVVPRAVSDARDFWDNLPEYVANGLSWLEGPQPDLYNDAVEWAERQKEGGSGGSNGSGTFDVRGYLDTGTSVLTGIGNALVVFVIATYVLLDRDYRIIRWAVRDLSESTQRRVWRTIPAVTQVVSGYVLGQGLICVCVGVFSFIVLSVLGVPSALILALIALFADAIPMVGIIVATVPAVVLAMTQSTTAGIVVLGSVLAYQQFENYILSPRIFGRTLQISPLAILIAVLVGQEVFGILGVILALPIAASIPVLERVWLGDETEDDTGEAPPSGRGPPEPSVRKEGDLGHFPSKADVAEGLDEGGPELARQQGTQGARGPRGAES